MKLVNYFKLVGTLCVIVSSRSVKNIKFCIKINDVCFRYIEHAAHMGDGKEEHTRYIVRIGHHGSIPSGSSELEVRMLREQLGLLHLQLQYERHRREVHAVRNRRLLGESRSNKALDEHNSALVSASYFLFIC